MSALLSGAVQRTPIGTSDPNPIEKGATPLQRVYDKACPPACSHISPYYRLWWGCAIEDSCSCFSRATKISLSSDQVFFLGLGPLTHCT